VQPPKLPTRQLWGDFQGKTGPVALILRFFNCNILLTNTKKRQMGPSVSLEDRGRTHPRWLSA
jgi:hypothetical protein